MPWPPPMHRHERSPSAARVDQVWVHFTCEWKGTHTEQAVLGLQHHVHAGWNVIGDERWDADAEIDVVATEERGVTLMAAFAAHPERFKGLAPTPNQVPKSVWINPPIKEIAKPEIIILGPLNTSSSNPLTCSEEAPSSEPRFPRQSM